MLFSIKVFKCSWIHRQMATVFAAVSDQFSHIQIWRSVETLCREVLKDLEINPTTLDGYPLSNYVPNNDFRVHTESMAQPGTFCDRTILIRISEMFNVRIVVTSYRS